MATVYRFCSSPAIAEFVGISFSGWFCVFGVRQSWFVCLSGTKPEHCTAANTDISRRDISSAGTVGGRLGSETPTPKRHDTSYYEVSSFEQQVVRKILEAAARSGTTAEPGRRS